VSLCSPYFLVLACFLAGFFSLSPTRRQRQILLSAVNFAFLVLLVPNPQSWVGFAAFLGGTYGLLKLERARPSPALVALGITVFVFLFVCVKRYAFIEWLLPDDWPLRDVELVGLSYMLFKFIHVLVDESQGQIARLNLLAYANYQLGLFTLLAGPIQRYEEFQQFWESTGQAEGGARVSLEAWNRLLLGMIKMGIVATLIAELIAHGGRLFTGAEAPRALSKLGATFYLYPVYLWANFSGYTDIVLGCAALIGFRLPENFNRPFLARNVIDFWNRWHISLTRWIRDYVFMASYKFIAERLPAVSKSLSYLLLFLSLLVAGMWHGATAGFVVFGALHGLGAAATQAYGDALKSRLGRAAFLRYQHNEWIRAAAMLVTFHFVCFTFLFFALGVGGTFEALRAARLQLSVSPWTGDGSRLAAEAVGLAAVACLVVGTLRTRIRLLAEASPAQPGRRVLKSLYWSVLCKVAMIVILFWGLWAFQQKDAVVVYQRF
jgi:D-alanyl-lipoteichoic acid acyltransferase DltB (MBOAT superfamily)